MYRERRTDEGRSDPEGWHVGDIINVRLTVETDEDLHYAIVEDKLPAGLEALNERLDLPTFNRLHDGARRIVHGHATNEVPVRI